MLDRWPDPARAALSAAIRHAEAGDYAVFDADNTLWHEDVTEAMITFLARRGDLTIDGLSPTLRPLPPRPGETIWSYYKHLCAASIGVGYLWAVQVFAGFTLRELQAAMHEMLAGAPIPVVDVVRGQPVPGQIPLPRAFLRMRELVAALESAGVPCWVVSASPEELVRLLACDPVHGLGVRPERVCGVNLLLEGPMGVDWGAKARAEGRAPAGEAWLAQRVTQHPVAPLTWYEGKVAGVRTWIDPVRGPLVAAGDSPSDVPMQLLVDPARGVRLRLRRDDSADAAIALALSARAGTDAASGWVTVSPADLCPMAAAASPA